MKVFHCQIRFQCFVFLKEQSLSVGQKIHTILFPFFPHLYSLEHQDKRLGNIFTFQSIFCNCVKYVKLGKCVDE